MLNYGAKCFGVSTKPTNIHGIRCKTCSNIPQNCCAPFSRTKAVLLASILGFGCCLIRLIKNSTVEPAEQSLPDRCGTCVRRRNRDYLVHAHIYRCRWERRRSKVNGNCSPTEVHTRTTHSKVLVSERIGFSDSDIMLAVSGAVHPRYSYCDFVGFLLFSMVAVAVYVVVVLLLLL